MAEHGAPRAGSPPARGLPLQGRRKDRLPAALSGGDIRVEAVRALSRGLSKVEVARRCGVSRQTVHSWERSFRERGPGALKPRRRGRTKSTPLLPWQEAQLAAAIATTAPGSMGLPYRCWTREAIAETARRSFGVALSIWMVGSYLRRWGFSPPRSASRLFERADPGLRRWLRPCLHTGSLAESPGR